MKRLKYQRTAVKNLTNDILLALSAGDKGQEICLKAVTGSGKTYMATKMIEKVIKDSSEELSFVWLSIGKGNLHKQSKSSIEKYIDTDIKCYYLEEFVDSSNTYIGTNTVVFANWESLRLRDKETGEWRNKYMRDGDHINFREIVNNSKTRLIMIIDESHVASDTNRALKIRQELNPDVIVGLTATPKYDFDVNLLFSKQVLLTEVPLQDVKDFEMIVKNAVVNPNLGKYKGSGKDSQIVVLKAEREHTAALKQSYKDENSNVLPLTGVIIPNAKEGDSKLEQVKLFYEREGITEKNGQLAIYLSGYKSKHFDSVNSPDSKIEIVIFKQGLDTGWDCPRAQNLVQFRNIKSEIFSAQTIGRFFRMPELKHYRSDILNYAYIFTNLGRDNINVAHDSYTPNMIKDKVAYLKSDLMLPVLNSTHRRRVDQGTVGKTVYNTLEKTFCDSLGIHGPFTVENIKQFEKIGLIFHDVDEYEEAIVKDVSVDIGSIGSSQSLTGYVPKEKSVNFRLSDNDRDAAFENLIWDNIRGHFKSKEKSISRMKEAIYNFFKVYFGTRPTYGGSIIIQSVVLHPENIDRFGTLIYKTTEVYAPKREREIDQAVKFEDYEWNLPELDRFTAKYEEVKAKFYAYDKCYLRKSRSPIEKKFEAYLESNPNNSINWWYKNGDKGRNYFGVKYRRSDGRDNTFYVDYIISFKDNRIGLIDSKGGLFAEVSKNKARGLQRYIEKSKHNIIGGILVDHHDKWRFNRNKEYKYDVNDMNGWEYLEDVL